MSPIRADAPVHPAVRATSLMVGHSRPTSLGFLREVHERLSDWYNMGGHTKVASRVYGARRVGRRPQTSVGEKVDGGSTQVQKESQRLHTSHACLSNLMHCK